MQWDHTGFNNESRITCHTGDYYNYLFTLFKSSFLFPSLFLSSTLFPVVICFFFFFEKK
uniref:Uncharacterized protein n=1 Tax=Octopus bimaculoides TaxID=37653 RepID=A0A0L8GTX3_OCTBM